MVVLLQRVTSVATRFFAPLVVAGAVIGFLAPSAFSWVLSAIKVLLGIIMLGMGITLTLADFQRVLTNPRAGPGDRRPGRRAGQGAFRTAGRSAWSRL